MPSRGGRKNPNFVFADQAVDEELVPRDATDSRHP